VVISVKFANLCNKDLAYCVLLIGDIVYHKLKNLFHSRFSKGEQICLGEESFSGWLHAFWPYCLWARRFRSRHSVDRQAGKEVHKEIEVVHKTHSVRRRKDGSLTRNRCKK
jgi:hypothetical protein